MVWSATEYRHGKIDFLLADIIYDSSNTNQQIFPVVNRSIDRGWLSILNRSIVSVLIRKKSIQKDGEFQYTWRPLTHVGSGVIVHPNGYFITSYSLISGANDIRVKIEGNNGENRIVYSELIKADPVSNLALVKIVTNRKFSWLPPGHAGRQGIDGFAAGVSDNRDLLLSEVLADSNDGLVSLGQPLDDAYIGAALLNRDGSLSGIITTLASRDAEERLTVIPVSQVIALFKNTIVFAKPGEFPSRQVVGNGSKKPAGTWIADIPDAMALTNTRGGVVVTSSEVGSPVYGMGFRTDDYLLKINGRPVKSKSDFLNKWGDFSSFETYRVLIVRNGRMMEINTKSDDRRSSFLSGVKSGEVFGIPLGWALELLLLGFVSGLVGGMMSMGGGVIKVSGLLLVFGYGMVIVRAVAFLINIFVYGAAAYRYNQRRLVLWDKILPMLPFALGGVMFGYSMGIVIHPMWIKRLLAVIACFGALRLIVESVFNKQETVIKYSGVNKEKSSTHAWAGLPMGIASGMLGISGGVIEVPIQNHFLNIPLRNAIANASTLIFVTSGLGAVISLAHGSLIGAFDLHIPLHITLFVIPGAVVGGQLGTRITRIVPLNLLRLICSVLMLFVAFHLWTG